MDVSAADLLDLSGGVYENDQTLNSSFEYEDLVEEMFNDSYSRSSEVSAGQIQVTVNVSNGLLNVHVVRAKNLKSTTAALCDSYVRISLSSHRLQQTQSCTGVCAQTNSPIFDMKYSFEMSNQDLDCRLHLAVWNKISGQRRCEFLGCTSFSVLHLSQASKLVDGWYHLLNEAVGSVAHSRVNVDEPIDDYLLLNNQRKVSAPCSSPDHIYDTLRADKYKYHHHQMELSRETCIEINNAIVNEEIKYEEIYERFPVYENDEVSKNEEPIYESIDDTDIDEFSTKLHSLIKDNQSMRMDTSTECSHLTKKISSHTFNILYEHRLSHADKTQGHTPLRNKVLAVRKDPIKSSSKPKPKRNNLRKIGRAALKMFLIKKKTEKKLSFDEHELQSAAVMRGSTTTKEMTDIWSQFIL